MAAPAYAALPSEPESTEAADSVTQEIDAEQDAAADEQIAERLRGIYGELEKFADVTVEVDQGVVALSGKVPDSADIGRAENIASRVSGVVTIDNSLERDISIAEGAGAISSLTDRFERFLEMLPLIALALGIVLVISAIGYAIAGLRGFWERVAPNVFLAELIGSAIRFVFVVGGIVIALDMLGAGALLGAVLGGAGVIGIALGFAMRDTIENYVASLMLSLRQPFRANDHVLIDDKEGRVIRLTSRATVLMTLDGNHLRIPNGQVFRAIILNYTRNPQRRFEFQLGIDADDDPEAARTLGIETLGKLDFVLDEPAPEVRIAEVGDSNVVLRFLGWVDQRESDWHKARSKAIAVAKTALEDAGFALPEPIYRLRFDERTTALPFENITESGREMPAKREPKRAVTATVTESDLEDIRPDNEVARMVDAERATPDEGQEKDLLDSGRPVE
ncbi:mechanosensitive ion channel domain-containing protein [Altererythrobacter sp. MF3-039]